MLRNIDLCYLYGECRINRTTFDPEGLQKAENMWLHFTFGGINGVSRTTIQI
jgi:hypothetical protein